MNVKKTQKICLPNSQFSPVLLNIFEKYVQRETKIACKIKNVMEFGGTAKIFWWQNENSMSQKTKMMS